VERRRREAFSRDCFLVVLQQQHSMSNSSWQRPRCLTAIRVSRRTIGSFGNNLRLFRQRNVESEGSLIHINMISSLPAFFAVGVAREQCTAEGNKRQKVIPRPSADYFVVGRRQKTVNKSRATRLLIGRWKNSEENTKTMKTYFIYFSVFSIDQSEAELQIVSRNSHHGVIIVAFEAITVI
jgi:hypothetical protein